MPDFNSLKQNDTLETPLFLFDCVWPSGRVERWSTHGVVVDGQRYHARVLGHNLFELKSSLEDGADGAARISLLLANADSYFSEIEWNDGFKGARLTIGFVFYDQVAGATQSDRRTIFRGVAGPPDEISADAVKVTFANQLSLQRVQLPELHIQRRCPWAFPSTPAQRSESLTGGPKGTYSAFYKCGYSAGEHGGVGNVRADGSPFTSCDYTRAQCAERGMFDQDAAGNPTRRFGGVEFVPASVLVRGYGDKSAAMSTVLDNEARYNDFVPLVYGTAWYQPPVVFARNDGNLTRFEVLLGVGEISRVLSVVVNDVELPEGVSGANMTGTGWFNLVTAGTRTGGFNLDFRDSAGNPLGDPYGSMAYLSVVVPNRINTGSSTPRIQVLLEGMKLPRFASDGQQTDVVFTNNPAWVLLDLLRRSGWSIDDIDVASFAATAAYCDEPVATKDLHGNATTVRRYQCNLVVRKRRSASDLVRGVRNGSALLLTYGSDGRVVLRAESSLALQQKDRPEGSNSTEKLEGGWPCYEFSDGSAAFSGIVRKANGEPHIRFWCRSASESANRYSVEFQDEFNEYQQDSLSLVDIDDATLVGQEITASLPALGLTNFDQASRILRLQLHKSLQGNLYVEFATSVRGAGLVPGDLIALTYEKEGLRRQPFRIVRVAPGLNYRTVIITAQYHDDEWYTGSEIGGHAGRRQASFGLGMPRPLLGDAIGANGELTFSVSETERVSADGSHTAQLSVGFSVPGRPGASSAAIPLLSLTPVVRSAGGALKGGQTLYYAVSALDEHGGESALSFTVRAVVEAGGDTNRVTLNELSFSSTTVSFRVYRGQSPSELVRIADGVALSGEFTDAGIVPDHVASPPDENYDHANFYWRLELQPESAADVFGPNRIGKSSLTMLPNDYRGQVVRIHSGPGAGQERAVVSNDATTLTVTPRWDIPPAAGSKFVVVDSSWQFGALTVQGPANFEVPDRVGATIQILGRAANVHNQESAAELSAITSWRIGSSGGGASDTDIPPRPLFGLIPVGHGNVELAGIGFHDMGNTRTITAGTLSLFYQDELVDATPLSLSAGIDDAAVWISIAGGPAPQVNSILQIESEVVLVDEVGADGVSCRVTRGSHSSPITGHGAGKPIVVLLRRTVVVPFARGFFGSPASGSFSYPIYLPDVRVVAAELFVTNAVGDSTVGQISFTLADDSGIRTLSGGQFSIQVDGTLSVQSDAAPPLLVEDSHSVRDVWATLRAASVGEVRLRLKQDGAAYCELAIPAGSLNASVSGFGKPPLKAQSQLSLEVVSVPQSPEQFPGADLTVTVRM